LFSVDIGAFEFEFPVATSENEVAEFSIFPNPASTYFVIHSANTDFKNGWIRVSNLGGEM
jgi:hypothetical protein